MAKKGRPSKKQEFVIVKNIPVPNNIRSSRGSMYPFGQLEVGDSFYCNVKKDSVYNMALRWKKKIIKSGSKAKNWSFIVRTEGTGTRIWRTK